MNCLGSLHNKMMKYKDYTYNEGLKFKIYDGYHNDDVVYTSSMRHGKRGDSSGNTVSLDGIGNSTVWNMVEDDDDDLSVEWTGYIYSRMNIGGIWIFKLNKGYLWFDTPSGYTKDNAVIRDGGTFSIYLQMNTYHPIRILYGKKKHNRYGNLRLTYQTPTSVVETDGTGVFVHI